MTEYLTVDGGTLAYEVTGEPARWSCSRTVSVTAARRTGSSHRAWWRPETGWPLTDLRGCGESSVGWGVVHPHRHRG